MLLDPNKTTVTNSDDKTVITSNTSCTRNIALALRQGVPKVLTFADTHAIADAGATSIFVNDGLAHHKPPQWRDRSLNACMLYQHPRSPNDSD